MEEIWKDIKGYEGLYQVSNFGRVRSLNYRRTGKVEVLSTGEVGRGYLHVKLCKNGKWKPFLVHRLVAEAFIPNLLNYSDVNHIDEDKHNNFAGTPENNFTDGNLEWCDRKYNCNYGTRIEHITEKTTNGKCSKPVLQFSKTGELVREWPSIREAGRNGFDFRNVSACCRGEYKQHKGYIWRYKE